MKKFLAMLAIAGLSMGSAIAQNSNASETGAANSNANAAGAG